MRRAALGLLLGTAVLQQLVSLPALAWSWLMVVFIPAALRWPRLRLPLCIGLGFLWANVVAHTLLAKGLAPELEGEDVVVEGVIASLPESLPHHTRFQFVPDSLRWQGKSQPLPARLLLSWYNQVPPLRVGERWRLQVRLKQPHGFMNPGGFDYEAWLFRQGIRAKGYVRSKRDVANPFNQRLAAAGWDYPVNQLRQSLRARLTAVLADDDLRGIILALALGDRQQISPPQWTVLTRTGTNHLVAISGLHVGLVAGLAFFGMRRLWRCSAWAVLRWPAPKAGALAGLLAALGYAMLAGFSVPTQRALVMVAVVMLALLLQRHTRPSRLLALALIVVLLLDPLAVLAPGFWLSFAAVAVILYGMQGRLGRPRRGWQRLQQWGRVQWLAALGLLPLLLLLFQKASLVAPLANLIAVPWVSLLTVPLTLLGSVLLWLLPPLGEALLQLAVWSLHGLWWLLQQLAAWPLAQWGQAAPASWVAGVALLGLLWLLAPRGMPARWLGAVWLLPLAFLPGPAIPPGQAQVALLDVGQGLAAVVRTGQHTLVFDTGPRFGSGFNTGEAVVGPYLRARGVTEIDVLVVSHGDNDHIGGVDGLLTVMPAGRILSSVPEALSPRPARACQAGQHWQWEGVEFDLLNPSVATPGHGRRENNRSCVLRVQAGGQRLLLTGDIEAGAERALIRQWGDGLAADVLVVPHHGSKTSSSAAFIQAVSPQVALFPVGYRNRYGFPKPAVVARYRQRGVRLLDSASNGAIELRLGADNGLRAIQTYRQQAARYWHQQPATGAATSGHWASLLK
jgi:competence protein ComEC